MPSPRTIRPELPIVAFDDKPAWASWLEENHAASPGVWLRIAKKASGVPSVTYEQAVEAALAYGWIDGQGRSYDEASYLQRFVPRRPKSNWSKINRARAEALIAGGEMRPAGLRAVESARLDGRWERAYDSPSQATVPDDFQSALDQNPAAGAFFAALDGRNRYALLFRLQNTIKPETRARRIQEFVRMLEQHEKLYP